MFFTDIIDRIRLPFRKDKESYSRIYAMLGFYPHNIQYYQQALVHKSTTRKKGKEARLANNERLEFLGDAVLDAIVGDIVYRHFKGKREGFLTNTRSKIVQRETLNKIAAEIGLDKLIQCSMHHTAHNSYMGGNAFEALVGAIYLDRGYDYCMRFMEKRILQRLINLDKVAYKEVNFKSKLIEWSQKNKVNVVFGLVEETKEGEGSPVFVSEVRIEGLVGGTGRGYSKKESQQMAAKEALACLKKRPQFIDAIFQEKSRRTAMEEEPTAIPEVVENEVPEPTPVAETSASEFDLSDITYHKKELSKEEIIAAAEEAAFQENA